MNENFKSPKRIFAALGPGDIVGAHREAMHTGNSLTTSIAFSEQLFDYCKAKELCLLAISSCSRSDEIKDGVIVAENRPKLRWASSGWSFHLRELMYAVYLSFRARAFRADVAIIDSGTSHYFALIWFRLLGIPIVANLHNVLWPQGFPPMDKKGRLIRQLNKLFFRHMAAGAIGVSPECERQVASESGKKLPFIQYRCQFHSSGFKSASRYEGGTFHVAFVGRVEANKGALDLVKISEFLKRTCPTQVVFHVCGNGSALVPLRRLIEQTKNEQYFFLHGHMPRGELLDLYSKCHAVIVPTTSKFAEGMPQVCAEAVIVGLPIVTSDLANASDVLDGCIAKAKPDDPESYAEQLCRLIDDPSFYNQLRSAASNKTEQFFDRSFGYAAAVDRMLLQMFSDNRIKSH